METEREWSSDELFTTVRDIERMLPSLEEYCAGIASELSGMEVGTRMFRRLGGMWLMHLAHQVAARQDAPETSPAAIHPAVPVDSWTHHQRLVSSVEYRNQVVMLARGEVSGGDAALHALNTPMPARSRIGRVVEGVLQGPSSGSRPVMVSLPYLKIGRKDRTFAIIRTRGKIAWVDPEFRDSRLGAVDSRRRTAMFRGVTGSDLFSQICRVASMMMPVAYGEDLARMIADLVARYEQPRLLYSANGSQFHLAYQVLSAVWGESGTRVLSHQHGGHQGLDEVHAGEEYEARSSDRHYTLGWSDSRPNVAPLCTAMPQRARRSEPGRLLLMSVSASDVVYRLQPFCMPSHVRNCTAETAAFLGVLTWPHSTVVRSERSIMDRLASMRPGFEWEGLGIQGTLSASRSELVVHNYLGVSWLETLAMNVPTVCFIPNGTHKFRESAQPYVDALARVGIIHHSGRDAARFVNSLEGNPGAWWNSAEVQDARLAFVSRYANFSDEWLDAWVTEFERMLSE